MKYIFLLATILTFAACNSDQSKIANLQESITQLEKANKQLQLTLNQPSFMHTVYFWLKEDLSAEDKATFMTSVKSLENVPSVARYRMGGPEATEARGVVDNTYSHALNVEFNSIADHDAYQIDPIHLAFVETCKDFWDKVIVYDNKM